MAGSGFAKSSQHHDFSLAGDRALIGSLANLGIGRRASACAECAALASTKVRQIAVCFRPGTSAHPGNSKIARASDGLSRKSQRCIVDRLGRRNGSASAESPFGSVSRRGQVPHVGINECELGHLWRRPIGQWPARSIGRIGLRAGARHFPATRPHMNTMRRAAPSGALRFLCRAAKSLPVRGNRSAARVPTGSA